MANAAERETCKGSGQPIEGLTVLDDPFEAARKAKRKVPTSGSIKVECAVCGRRVGTYKRRKGENAGELTVESHWVPRPRAAKQTAEAVAVAAG